MSAEIVHRLHAESTFGRIKHQKILYLCEHIPQLTGISGNYDRKTAGPLDNKLIYANEAELKKQKWYEAIKRDSYGHSYCPLEKAGNHVKYLENHLGEHLPKIIELIELMRNWTTERCEIFCTAFAAWNDLLIWNRAVTDEMILHEILYRWHQSKKRIPKDRWCKAINWIKKQGYTPEGFGRATTTAPSLEK